MEKTELTHYKVIVLGGGWSDERDISMASARACRDALEQAGFGTVDLVDVADASFIDTIAHGGYDVAFVAMHGRYGEDGSIQGLLEILHLPYTFSGVLASALSTEKEKAKDVCRAAGIPVPRGRVVEAGCSVTADQAAALVEELRLPLFVKPAANGSSFGVSRVTATDRLPEAVRAAGAQGGRVLVEECVEGTEITVPVIGNDEPTALPVIEIAFDSAFYDCTVKYEPAELHHIIPARLPRDVYERAQGFAVRAHVALGCRGASRTDFIVRADGTPVMLETNSIPGMTEQSLFPDAARRAGIEFPELCRRLVMWALEDAASGREIA
ncbi:D-alanine--D-alanine ligase family protein [Olsenella massiliensis]|uniref:D-alanine--D-alanine ligase family protein n=1 Tax=Olsenella massiliensis TaxID=1622075 RepID=UPI00071E4ABF|nr:D-alanine--D-alanine ligase [Olsenella massiliensis]